MTDGRADIPSQRPAGEHLVSSGGPLGGPPFFSDFALLKRHPQVLVSEKSAVLVVDLQERLLAAIPRRAEVLGRVRTLLAAADLLDLPVHVTEQYPAGLGRTAGELREGLDEACARRYEKTSFTALGAPGLAVALDPTPQILLAGVETHVCIAQTALDLLAAGLQVHILADAVAARRDLDHAVALDRLRSAGAVVTTLEAALFEMIGEAGTDRFRAVLNLVKKG